QKDLLPRQPAPTAKPNGLTPRNSPSGEVRFWSTFTMNGWPTCRSQYGTLSRTNSSPQTVFADNIQCNLPWRMVVSWLGKSTNWSIGASCESNRPAGGSTSNWSMTDWQP